MFSTTPLSATFVVLLGLQPAPQHQSEPLFEQTAVFVGGHDNINTYRIPSVICTAQGTVLAFCEGRRDSNVDGSPTHLVLKRSTGNAEPWDPPRRPGRVPAGRSRHRNMTWQPMQTLLRTNGRDAYMNPVPLVDRSDAAVYLLVNHHARYQEGRRGELWLLKSADEGATWSAPTDLTPQVGPKELGPGVGIQMQNGRLVVPVYDGVIYSDDDGRTWRAGGPTTGPVSETQVVELVDASLMLNTRGSPRRTICISRDGGLTWGVPYADPALSDSELWGGCQASLLRFTRTDAGFARNRLLFSNPADPRHRFDLTVRLSYDEGKTWPVAKQIRQGPAAYSSITVFPDASIGILYETGNTYGDVVEYYAQLAFARFNLAWLTDGRDQVRRTK